MLFIVVQNNSQYLFIHLTVLTSSKTKGHDVHMKGRKYFMKGLLIPLVILEYKKIKCLKKLHLLINKKKNAT